jgi:hypothetical protein
LLKHRISCILSAECTAFRPMCYVWFTEQAAIICPPSSHWFVFVMETYKVYFAVETQFLNTSYKKSWPVTADARVQSQTSPCGLCRWQGGTGTGFSASTSVLPCQYQSTNATYASSSSCCSYQKENRPKPGNLRKKTVLFWEGGCSFSCFEGQCAR